MIKVTSSARTDPGKKRKNNEDAFLLDDQHGLYAAADGIGGHEGGEIASRITVDTLAEVMPGLLRGDDVTPPFSLSLDVDPRISALRYAITLSNQKILQTAAQNPSLAGMGTTISALILWRETASIAHVGDSRAYLLREGELRQLTSDHSFVAEQIRAGKLTPEQARASTYRHVITRALGIDKDVSIDHVSLSIRKNDTLLLCTDGLTELVEDAEIGRILDEGPPETATYRLIRTANERGGVDNITAVVVSIVEPV